MNAMLVLGVLRKAETDEECIERARKYVRLQQRWGKWYVAFHLAAAITIWTVVIVLGFWLGSIITDLGGAQQAGNAVWTGFALGMVLGFFAGVLLYHGYTSFVEALKGCAGDRTHQLLVEYHDAIVALAREGATESRPAD